MGSPARIVRTYQDDFTADGWGTLKTPGHVYANTLRIKDKQVAIDSFFVWVISSFLYAGGQTTQVHNYRWVDDNGPDTYLLQIDADSLGTMATRSEYQIASAIHVQEISTEHVQVHPYPNPSTSEINIDFGVGRGLSGAMTIYNSVGEVVRTSEFSDINHLRVYVNTLSSGLYHFSVLSSDNKIREGSFMVSH